MVFFLQRSKLGRNLGPAEAWERKQIESLPSTVSVPGVRVRCVRACVRRVCVVTGSRGCRDRSILSGGERGGGRRPLFFPTAANQGLTELDLRWHFLDSIKSSPLRGRQGNARSFPFVEGTQVF